MRLLLQTILLLGASFTFGLIHAQEYRIKQYGLADGLSQTSVKCLLQDHKGLLWIGTEDGLNRFDGYDFEVYKQRDGKVSLPSNWINFLFEDRQNHLWIATNAGLVRLNPRTEEWTLCPIPWVTRDKTVFSIMQDAQGRIWVCTQTGLFRLENPEAAPTDWVVRNLRELYPDLPKETPQRGIEDSNGSLYFCFSNQRGNEIFSSVYIYDAKQDQFRELGLLQDGEGIERLSLLQDSILCLGTVKSGLVRFNLKADKLLPPISGDSTHPYIRSFETDRNAGIWSGTYEELFYLPADSDSAQKIITPASTGPVFAIIESQEGHIWFGSSQGLWQLQRKQNKFETFSLSAKEPFKLAKADLFGMLVSSKGEFWAVAYNYGLIRLIPKAEGGWQKFEYPAEAIGLSTAQNIDMKEDADGAIWLAGFGGLVRLQIPDYDDPAEALPPVVKVWSASPEGIRSPYITDILPDPDGSYWLADYTAGVEHVQIKDEQLSVARYSADGKNPFSTLDNRADGFQFDREGNLWVCSRHGLSRAYHNEAGELAFRHILLPPIDSVNLRGKGVKMFYQDETGVLWLASEGLYRVELAAGAELSPWDAEVSPFLPFNWQRFGIAEGLTNESVYGILPDKNAQLWLSHNQGIDRFDPEALSFRNYDVEDGLQSNEFSANAFAQGQNDYLYFGGIEGFSRFHPDSVRDRTLVPKAMIASLSLYNQKVKVGQQIPQSKTQLLENIAYAEQISLSWRDYLVGFDFVGIGYGATERYQFAYQMEGLDEEWQYIGTRRFASFTNLGAGDYVLKLKAANEDGVWQEEPTSLQIHVSTPPWRTWWAYTIYALLLAALIYALIRYRTRKLRQEMLTKRRIEQARLAEREKVRARSSRDFHDESGNKITKISLYTGLLRQRLDEVPELESMLDKIDDNVKALSGGMRDFIWALDPQKDRLSDTAQRLFEFGQNLFEDSGINLQYHNSISEDTDYRFDLNIRRQLLLIFKEAMNNCLKYAEASEVQLRIEEEEDWLAFSFQDNGLGFDREQLARVNGLNNMQQRVKEMGADIEIKSVPSIGTQIKVLIPKEIINHPNG
ncbi:MAG: two-component regulator propeller domain-containing protein [Bacteroidota bacterium]